MGKKILQKKRSLFLLIILMILSLIPLSGCGADQRQLSEEKTKMVQYLEKKYARQFVVEDIKFYREGIGAPKQVEAKLHPKDDKELTFAVYKFLEGNYSYSTVYKENYLGILWGNQAKDEVFAFLKTIYKEVPRFGVEIIPSYSLINQINSKVPSIEEVLYVSKTEINFNINIFTTGEYNDLTCLEHAEKIYKLIGFVKRKKIENPGIYYVISIEKPNQNAAKYICWLNSEKIKKINNLSEIVQFFNKSGGE